MATGNTYTPSVSSTSTFYASAFNSTTSCESARVPVVAAINPLPQLPVSTQAYYGRFGFGTVTFSIQPITDPSTSIQWLTQSDVVIANENKPVYTTDFSSTSVVKVKTIHTNGCQSNSLSLTANVLTPPSIQITGNTYLANGQSVTLSLPSTYPNFQWKRDGVNLVGSTSNSISVSQPGRYTCSITLSNGVTDESEHIYVTTLTNEPVAVPAPTYASDAPPLVTNTERKNYIRKYIAKKPALTPADFVFNNPDMTEIGIETQYLDGLGMPIQKVQKNASPTGKDIVVPAVYDQWAREAKVFLPYTSNSTDIDVDGFRKNAILEQFNFYRNAPAEIAKTGVAFSETEFEASPLNRIVKKSSPGETFKLGSGRELKSNTWSLSSEDLPVRVFTVSEAGALLQTGNFYSMRDLLVSEITDQNNERAREYKDKEGRVILKRVKSDGNEWLNTYYVYDGIGNLAYVLPPLLHKRSFPYAAASVDSIAFQYRYDARQRLIEKRVPGSGWTYIIYDALDRVVLVQNPAQRTSNRWLFTKYDVFDRPIMTGETVNATSYATLRSTISQQAGFETKDSNNNYTLNNSTPAVLSAEVHTQTFYDNYNLPTPFQISTTHSFVMESTLIEGRGHPDTFFKRVKGQVTATLVRNLDTQAWLESVNYYNDRQQIIQTISRNSRNGMDRISIAYENGVSKSIIKTITRHNVGAQELAIIDRVEYDNEDRPITKYHKTGNMAEIRTANHVYNEIGQLVEKNLHSTTGQRWMQSEDYRYAISGALKSINELSTGVSDANDLFSMELFFEEGYALKQFNGNITGMRWRSARTGQEQSYGYVYDPLNRLRVAEYKRKDGAANTWTLDLDRYKEVVTGYDANGNIRGIQRNGQLANQTFGQIDNLVYSYNGNTLLKVRDMAGDAAGFKDDGTTTSDPVNDYQYDANGSLVKDDNKQIQTIEYNYFNLPRRVVKSNNEYIKYIYNALGQKMRQEVYSSTNVLQKATDYCGNFVYENNNLQFFSHADGRVVNKGSGQWQYQYFAKDHLGNNRITYASEFTTYTADMETATNPAFTNYTRTEQDLFDHTDAGTVYKFAHRLTGASNSQVGLAKSLQVQAGDTVKVEVWAKYFGTTSGSSGLSTFANSLLTAFGLQAPVAGENGTPAAALNGYGNFVAGGGYSGTNTGPRGFLNILFFDKNYVLKDVAFQKLDESYVQPVGSLVKQPHQKLQRQIVADEPGFVYIYVSNEGYQIQDIYFDDMVIKHSYTQVHQEENYYPFGLTFNSYQSQNFLEQKFTYNGKEKQDELNVDWLDYGARMYMPELGRWGVIDPLTEKYFGESSYSYTFNNPVFFNDPTGMEGNVYGVPSSQFSAGGSVETVYDANSNGLSFNYGGKSYSSMDAVFEANPNLTSVGVFQYGKKISDAINPAKIEQITTLAVNAIKAASSSLVNPDPQVATSCTTCDSPKQTQGSGPSPWEVGWEWLTGTGPRHRDFTNGDQFTEMLRQHDHVEATRGIIRNNIINGGQLTGKNPYGLGGIEGVGKYLKDYSTLLTGGLTGNLAVTYLGSYGLNWQVTAVNGNLATIMFTVNNSSTIQSAFRPPVLGYTDAWQSTVGSWLNSQFSSGPMSTTSQTIRWTETIKIK